MPVFTHVRIALWYPKHKSRYLVMASPSTFSLAVKVWETVAPQASWTVSHGCLREKAAVASFTVTLSSPCCQTAVSESSGRVEAAVGRWEALRSPGVTVSVPLGMKQAIT